MLKWIYDRRLEKAGDQKYNDALEGIEDIFSNKGALRILLLLGYYGKPLRHTQLREVCKLPVNTLNHTLNRLIGKGIVEVFRKDVEIPRKQKDIPHYRLTKKGRSFHRQVFQVKMAELEPGSYEIKKLKELLGR